MTACSDVPFRTGKFFQAADFALTHLSPQRMRYLVPGAAEAERQAARNVNYVSGDWNRCTCVQYRLPELRACHLHLAAVMCRLVISSHHYIQYQLVSSSEGLVPIERVPSSFLVTLISVWAPPIFYVYLLSVVSLSTCRGVYIPTPLLVDLGIHTFLPLEDNAKRNL